MDLLSFIFTILIGIICIVVGIFLIPTPVILFTLGTFSLCVGLTIILEAC